MSAGTRLNIGAHYAWRSSRSNFVYASSFNRCRCQNLANGATTQHTLDVPDDFESLIALYLVFIPNGTNPGAQFTTGITWGARAAANNTNVGIPLLGGRRRQYLGRRAVCDPLAGGACGRRHDRARRAEQRR
jgi:hypothetical protein